jgi:tetratricopeptide (TPR) repeat protein
MDITHYDMPLQIKDAMEYEQEIANVYEILVAAGAVRPGQRQKVDLALLRQILEISKRHDPHEAEAILPDLQDDLEPDGCTVITRQFLERIEEVAMAVVSQEVIGEAANALNEADTPTTRGVVLFLAGREAEALAAFNEVIESGQYGDLPYWDRGRVYQWVGDHRRALADFDRYLASPCLYRRPTAWVWRSQVLAQMGRTAEAVQSLAQAVADMVAHPNPLRTGLETADPPVCCPAETEKAEPADRQSTVANELRCIINGVKQLEASGTLPAELRPQLDEIKADIVRLRGKLGF